jgi:U3 small nucleolar ribonucleoprotein component
LPKRKRSKKNKRTEEERAEKEVLLEEVKKDNLEAAKQQGQKT